MIVEFMQQLDYVYKVDHQHKKSFAIQLQELQTGQFCNLSVISSCFAIWASLELLKLQKQP